MPPASTPIPGDDPVNPLHSLPIEFVGSFPSPDVRLDPPQPEIALVGRSNVGKSSLLNALVGRRQIARVSGTPGKTTLLNAYRLPGFYLVDLPGYGFARASKRDRQTYRRLLDGYLAQRAELAGVVWLLDIRHDPSEEDWTVQEQLAASGRPVLVALTKSDKLGRQAQQEHTERLTALLGLADDQVQATSSRTGSGLSTLGASIFALVQAEKGA